MLTLPQFLTFVLVCDIYFETERCTSNNIGVDLISPVFSARKPKGIHFQLCWRQLWDFVGYTLHDSIFGEQ